MFPLVRSRRWTLITLPLNKFLFFTCLMSENSCSGVASCTIRTKLLLYVVPDCTNKINNDPTWLFTHQDL